MKLKKIYGWIGYPSIKKLKMDGLDGFYFSWIGLDWIILKKLSGL
jgi:hypothetical protein